MSKVFDLAGYFLKIDQADIDGFSASVFFTSPDSQYSDFGNTYVFGNDDCVFFLILFELSGGPRAKKNGSRELWTCSPAVEIAKIRIVRFPRKPCLKSIGEISKRIRV